MKRGIRLWNKIGWERLMVDEQDGMTGQNCKEAFESLLAICHRDIKFNGIGLRILGVHYMDHGMHWMVMQHRHTFFEFHYVIQGQVYTTLEGKDDLIHDGNYYVIPPGMPHAHHQEKETSHLGVAIRWEFINETIETKELEQSLIDVSAQVMSDDKKIWVLFQRLVEANGELEQQLILMEVICALARHEQRQEPYDLRRQKKRQQNQVVQQAIRFIEENYTENILVSDVANSVYISYSQISRLFKKYVGMSVNQFINAYRMDKAKVLLKTTDHEIRWIAEKTGFNSEFYFCNAFKQHVGMAPSRYRER